MAESLRGKTPYHRLASLHRPTYFEGSNPSAILFNKHFNKGTAFTYEERATLQLEGLLPGKVESIETQCRRCLKQLRNFTSPMAKYIYLSSLRERSDTLFYKLVYENLEETLPIVYTPTVGQACLEFGLNYRAAEGMYFSRSDRGKIRQMLDNWRPNMLNEVSIIVVTDGSRILGLGDLGTCGMGIPIGKLSLYVAAAGFHPATTLPVVLDTGTNNKSLLEDEFYLGCRHPRLPNEEFYPLVEEFMSACKAKWPQCLVQFEDFSNDHAFDLLEKYRKKQLCFNDDIQGTGAVIAAGFLNAIKIAKLPVTSHRIVFLGAGAAGIGVAEQMCALLHRAHNVSMEDAKKMFYLVDSKGLVTEAREGELASFKKPWARKDITEPITALEEVVRKVQATALIGLSGQANQFTSEIMRQMCEYAERPIIFPLSNPTKNSETTAEAAFTATNGKVLFCSGSPFPPVTAGDKTIQPSQGNNMYIFPGLGFGAWLCNAKEVSDGMIAAAAESLASQVAEETLQSNNIFPPLSSIRQLSTKIAVAVIEEAKKEHLAQNELPDDLEAFVSRSMYVPGYLDHHDVEVDAEGRYRLASCDLTRGSRRGSALQQPA